MNKLVGLGLVLLAAILLATACGPSKADCDELCDWAATVCNDRDSCVDDCHEASRGDVEYAMDNCLDRTVSSCKSANCCLRFTYTEYYFQQNCL